ncbi:hypothetical protein [Mycobacterium leprae]|nr:hypothetical protein [Mycobacterium leprae]
MDRCHKLPNDINGYLTRYASDIAITAVMTKYMQRWPLFRLFAERK